MKKYNVQITGKALTDMEEIYIYIAEHLKSPENAMKQYNRIAEDIEGLNMFPERIKIMKSEPEHTMELQQLLIDNYFVFYTHERKFLPLVSAPTACRTAAIYLVRSRAHKLYRVSKFICSPVYIIKDEQVIVIRVLYSTSDISKRLKDN